ncbi:oligosaccharide flippase family protein [Shewanella sp. Isolate13]|uniref:oligosaccharide flippase family protein n=1 Tax=Shewanella sp. Isolate13 TaxID=2908531 RepID=UPI001EFD924F|nr:oligosaccharide flippase family protein [Shewanella sp. Isolate13]MCG9730984.1 oligosaccharide flippase family protein [Shewanella sp. Isolate13]
MQSESLYQRSLSTLLNGALAKGLFWLGSAQVLGRVVRLGSSIIIARLLTPEVFGQVAIILTCFELICTPTRRISSAALIKMDDNQLKRSLSAANRVNWLAAIIAFVAMSLLSWPLAIYYDDLQLILPMILMATSYLLLPFGMLYAAINLRLNRMRVVGRAVLWQTVFDAILTGSFALLGLGIWAIILPKIIVVFIWIGVHRYHNPLPELLVGCVSEPRWQLLPARSRTILKFGLQVGLGDLAIALRQNIDYILVGYFLGIEALGVYFFAFNASLGISLGLVQSYGTALYSYLCQTGKETDPKQLTLEQKYLQSLKFIMLLTLPIISLQALLAPLYVPWVYGQKWLDAGALPIFILLCLSGLVRPLGEAASQYLISSGRGQLNLLYNSAFTAILAITIALSSLWGLQAVALGILLAHLLVMPSFTLYLKLTQSITDTAHYRSEAHYDC